VFQYLIEGGQLTVCVHVVGELREGGWEVWFVRSIDSLQRRFVVSQYSLSTYIWSLSRCV